MDKEVKNVFGNENDMLYDHYQIPIFMKSSLIEIVGEENMRHEYPLDMRRLQK